MLKVLLVDDEVIIRQGLKKIIDWQSIGFEIAGEASNGDEAIELTEILSPDVVITDIRMAQSDGIELLRELKKRKTDCKIIVISGYDDFSYVQEAMAANAYSYLFKSRLTLTSFIKLWEKCATKFLPSAKPKAKLWHTTPFWRRKSP
ncbi:MAG: response regulator [Clostridiales bacterium]|nr:MAG: response regulator [Clostridiales bacterium]